MLSYIQRFKVQKCDEHDEDFLNVSEFCRLSGQVNQDEACSVLEDPTEEIIVGYINDIVTENDNDFIYVIDCFNYSTDHVNKNTRKALEEGIDE